MRKIRNNVFETNSSSMHSFTVSDSTYNNLEVDPDDGYVHTNLGEFGWEVKNYYDSETKLSYILLVAASVTGDYISYWVDDIKTAIDNFIETEEFKRIEDTVKEEMSCDGIIIDDTCYGYIDHQSLGYQSLDEFLDEAGANSVHQFIFGNIVLHTDNDNY